MTEYESNLHQTKQSRVYCVLVEMVFSYFISTRRVRFYLLTPEVLATNIETGCVDSGVYFFKHKKILG